MYFQAKIHAEIDRLTAKNDVLANFEGKFNIHKHNFLNEILKKIEICTVENIQ